MRQRIARIVLAALAALAPTAAMPAFFDDGNDRAYIKDLAKKENLSDEERAILRASRKVGAIGGCNNKFGGNAFLIMYDGKPAVVTSAHLLIDKKERKLKCSSWDEVQKKLSYMPNVSFLDSKNPDHDKKFRFKEIGLVWPPANWEDLKDELISDEEDMAIFYLETDVTKEVMPDGSERGYFDFSKYESKGGIIYLYMIGASKDMNNMFDMIYQRNCVGYAISDTLFHGCDTLKSSSASVLATYEDGELRFRGLHTGAVWDGDGYKIYPESEIKNPARANIGTSSDYILNLLSKEGVASPQQ